MNFFDLVNKRESVRGYLDKEVEKEKIIKIIEAARVAPSACNAQPWKFVVVNDKNLVGKIAENLYDPMIYGYRNSIRTFMFGSHRARTWNLYDGMV